MILDRLIWSDSFERFIASKYPSEKRFGLEGGESLIPGMKALVSRRKSLYLLPRPFESMLFADRLVVPLCTIPD